MTSHNIFQCVVCLGCLIIVCELSVQGGPISHESSSVSDVRSSRIHGSKSDLAVTIYRDSTNEPSIRLGLPCTEAHEPMPGLTVLRIPNPSLECFDFWISSTQKPLTCLVLVQRRRGAIVQHSVFPYRVVEDMREAVPYKSHLKMLRRRDGDHYEEVSRPEPLSVESILRSKLDPKSPVNDVNLTSVVVRTVASVQIVDSARGPIVSGLLNSDWRFLLSLMVDEDAEIVRPDHLVLDPLHE